MMALDTPIIVTGTPRSGKSCVARLLALDDAFHFAGEPVAIWDMGMGGRPDDRRTAAEATPSLRAKIESKCEQLVHAANKQRYVDAFSYHALRIPFLAAVLPQARIIHMIRAPEGALPEMIYGWTLREPMINTFIRRRTQFQLGTLPRLAIRFLKNHLMTRIRGRRTTWGPRVPGLAEYSVSRSTALIAAFQWMRMVEIALDDLAAIPRERWLEVRFEELRADPAKQARRIASFAGVRDVDALVDRAMRYIEPDRVHETVVQPTRDEWKEIRRMIAPLAERLGYPAKPNERSAIRIS